MQHIYLHQELCITSGACRFVLNAAMEEAEMAHDCGDAADLPVLEVRQNKLWRAALSVLPPSRKLCAQAVSSVSDRVCRCSEQEGIC